MLQDPPYLYIRYIAYHMKRLILLIVGQSKELELDESFIITHENPYLLVKKVTVFWKYNNITNDLRRLLKNYK